MNIQELPRKTLTTYQTRGIIKYYSRWCVAEVDADFSKYYLALLPRAWGVRPQRTSSHVSIIRFFESPNMLNWGFGEGKTVTIDCVPGIHSDGVYYWINCFCNDIGRIRVSLGLNPYRVDDYSNYNCHHITVGNVK